MKKFVYLIPCFLATRAFAIFGVEDTVEVGPITSGFLATYHAEDLIKLAETIKKAEDQIRNQLTQIEQAKNLLNVQNRLKATIGDWEGVIGRAQSIKLSASNLSQDWSLNVKNALVVDYGNPDLAPRDATGQVIVIPPDVITKQERVRAIAKEAYDTLKKTDDEAKQINAEIGDAYKRMTEPGITQQEYEKLRGKIQTLAVRLQALDMQRNMALQMIHDQRAIDDNDKSRTEEIDAFVQESNRHTFVKQIGGNSYNAFQWVTP